MEDPIQRCVFVINDPGEFFGNNNTIRSYLLQEFPEIGKWFEIVGGKRSDWGIDTIIRQLDRSKANCQIVAIVASEKVGRNIVADVAKLGISRSIPVIILSNEIVAHTVYKDFNGQLGLRDSLIGDPVLDIPIQEIKPEKARTKNLINHEAGMGRITTVNDIINLGREGLKNIDGFGPTTIEDIIETVHRQFGVEIE